MGGSDQCLSSGAFSVGPPPSLVGCDWVYGKHPQVVSHLSEKDQRSGRSTPARRLPQWATSHDLTVAVGWLTCPTTKSVGPMVNSAGDHPTTHAQHSTV